MDDENLDQENCRILWVTGACDLLKELGMLAGSGYGVTEKGWETWKRIDDVISLTEEELEILLSTAVGIPPAAMDSVIGIVMDFQYRRLDMVLWCSKKTEKSIDLCRYNLHLSE